ncbi:MAG: DUF6516 family protein [Elusimicrobiota bacterium]|nr:DUF6516 family protein [Elusimicrobiota bacterium]
MVCYTISIMATLVLHQKLIDKHGGIEERVIWLVPKAKKHPEGIRYHLAYIPRGSKKPSVLFDNHYPKGHHKHIGDHEMPYSFVSPEKLLEDFNRAVKEVAIYEDPGNPNKKP